MPGGVFNPGLICSDNVIVIHVKAICTKPKVIICLSDISTADLPFGFEESYLGDELFTLSDFCKTPETLKVVRSILWIAKFLAVICETQEAI